MTLTKDDITTSIRNRVGLPKARWAELTGSLLEIMKKTLESGEDVLINGFGKFCIKEKNERRGINSATGNELALEARRVVTFRCSGVLKDRINGKS